MDNTFTTLDIINIINKDIHHTFPFVPLEFIITITIMDNIIITLDIIINIINKDIPHTFPFVSLEFVITINLLEHLIFLFVQAHLLILLAKL